MQAPPVNAPAQRKSIAGSLLFWDLLLTTLLGSLIVFVVVRYCIDHGPFAFTSDLLAKHVFWILVTIPGLAAVVHFLVAEMPRHRRQLSAFEELAKIPAEKQADEFRTKDFSGVVTRYATEFEEIRPFFSGVLFGAACFVLVFGIAAGLSSGSAGVGIVETAAPPRKTPATGAEQKPSPTPTVAPSPAASAEANARPAPPPALAGTRRARTAAPAPSPAPGLADATPSPVPSVTPQAPRKAQAPSRTGGQGEAPDHSDAERDREGRVGLVFAAYGAYIYVIRLFIGRLNSSGLSGKFLLRLALRGAMALVLGYTAGALGIFTAVAEGGPSRFAYFCVGLFPAWAMSALQQRGRGLFSTQEPGCETQSLSLVDGLDDDTSDRLVEMGVSDVQHLAYSNPFELILRTGFSPNLVLDWMDQALLINYCRDKIVQCRRFGIRGSIDMATLYADYTEAKGLMSDEPSSTRKDRAKTLLKSLAERAEIPEPALLSIGRALFEDQHVNLIWDLWQQPQTLRGSGAAPVPSVERAPDDPNPPRPGPNDFA